MRSLDGRLEEVSCACAVCRRSTSTRPFAHLGHVHREHGAVGRFTAVLRVLVPQQHQRPLPLLALVEYPGAAAEADPPEAAPVLLIVVDDDRDVGTKARVLASPHLCL